MDPLIRAVRELRGHLGDTQQAFAHRLGLSIRAIANYEKDRRPTGTALAALARAAQDAERAAQDAERAARSRTLSDAFVRALIDELGLKELDFRMMSGTRRGPKYERLDGFLITHLAGEAQVEYGFAFFDMIEELISGTSEQKNRAKARLDAFRDEVNRDPERMVPKWARMTDAEKKERGLA
jgi:transcriptional regulator with XRE-family HTH domain